MVEVVSFILLAICVLSAISSLWELFVLTFIVRPLLKTIGELLSDSKRSLDTIGIELDELNRLYNSLGWNHYLVREAERQYYRTIGIHEGRMIDVNLLYNKLDAKWKKWSLWEKVRVYAKSRGAK